MAFLEVLSAIFGWIYFFSWSLSFYPQPLLNYRRRSTSGTTVGFPLINTLAHALVLSTITASQYVPGLWRGFERVPRGARPSRFIAGIELGCIAAVLLVAFVVVGRTGDASQPPVDPARDWFWLDVLYAVSYVKLVITLIKYTTQIAINRRNRSTQGWSIWQISLDFSGGVLSIAQQGINSYLQGNCSGITGNPVKFALGNVSMLYNLAFIA